jgi:F0F1-type ATP synthase membrane subunit c/vacuolar-type H+-ATPase subunit K
VKPRFEVGEVVAIVLALIGLVCVLLLLFDTPPPSPGP